MKKTLLITSLIFLSFVGYSQTRNELIEAFREFILTGDSLRATTQIDLNDTTLATKQYVLNTAGAGNGWDSLTWNASTGQIVWWYAGIEIDSINTDNRYVLLSDSTSQYLTAYSINNLINQSGIQTVYRITLPINGTLSGSAAAATDLPSGWSLSVSGGDLQINHGLGRYSASVNVRYNTSGDSYRQLRNFDNAYSGVLDVDNNNLTIESISTFYTAYELRITIIFE
jgi:hypothetical protein